MTSNQEVVGPIFHVGMVLITLVHPTMVRVVLDLVICIYQIFLLFIFFPLNNQCFNQLREIQSYTNYNTTPISIETSLMNNMLVIS